MNFEISYSSKLYTNLVLYL